MTTEQRSLYSHVKYSQTAAIPLVQSEIAEYSENATQCVYIIRESFSQTKTCYKTGSAYETVQTFQFII